MTSSIRALSADTAREGFRADLEVIDAAYGRLRQISTDVVGNAFRVEVAERLETQERINRGLSYRMFGEIADPPDGDDPALPAGVRMRDLLQRRLRITADEVRRRVKVAGRLRPRRSLTGPPLPPLLAALGAAVDAGQVGQDHIAEVCKALDRLPAAVPAEEVDKAEKTLVEHAIAQDSAFVAELGRGLADVLNPDGLFDERDRAARRGLTFSRQGPDGMSKLSGWLTPESRAYLEAVGAAVRPGHHVPGAEQTVVDAATDTRTGSQRLHDALAWGLRTAIASGDLGTHRGHAVTVIARTTAGALEQAAQAIADPSVPMPPPARTGGGSSLPMRDLIAMAAAGSMHYLAVFDDHTERPLYLGRSKRLASSDQRLICYSRDGGCTHPRCTAPGYHCEVDHAPSWVPDGRTDADSLFFGCGPHNKAKGRGEYTTTVTGQGRLAWTDGTESPQLSPQVNRLHHPEELLADSLEPPDPPEEHHDDP